MVFIRLNQPWFLGVRMRFFPRPLLGWLSPQSRFSGGPFRCTILREFFLRSTEGRRARWPRFSRRSDIFVVLSSGFFSVAPFPGQPPPENLHTCFL